MARKAERESVARTGPVGRATGTAEGQNERRRETVADQVRADAQTAGDAGTHTAPSGSKQLVDPADKTAALFAKTKTPRQPMRRTAAKILFFIDGNIPTAEDYAAAGELGATVMFRNARKIVPGAPIENADAVAGNAIPDDYARMYPVASAGAEYDELPEGAVARPNRTHRQASGMAPDDVRPGTLDTGLAHASGTGSSMPGQGNRNPETEAARTDVAAEPTPSEAAAAWKTGKTG